MVFDGTQLNKFRSCHQIDVAFQNGMICFELIVIIRHLNFMFSHFLDYKETTYKHFSAVHL